MKLLQTALSMSQVRCTDNIYSIMPKERSCAKWCGFLVSLPMVACRAIKQVWKDVFDRKIVEKPTIHKILPPYLMSLTGSLPQELICLVDEYYLFDGAEVTQWVIAILQDGFQNQGVLTEMQQIGLQKQYSPWIREIDFSAIEITIAAFGQLVNIDDIHRYFCECLTRYFPECTRLIIPSEIHYSHQTARNAFCTRTLTWSHALLKKYTSPFTHHSVKPPAKMKIDICDVDVKEPTTAHCFHLSSFFVAVNRNSQT